MTHRTFAIIPAAGHSRRMGRHKLLLPLNGASVIRSLIAALEGVVDRIFVLIRADDSGLRQELDETAATVVEIAADPPEMRDSIEWLLREIQRMEDPMSEDSWLLIPADHPIVNRETLLMLLRERAERSEAVHVPVYHGRRGHPTLFPWGLAAEVFELPESEGVNALLRRPSLAICEHAVDDPAVLWDLDTPGDYERLVASQAPVSPR
jgi:molybdenum cofactor cytidylyltransferase